MICANLDRLEIYVAGAHYATATPDTTDYGHLPHPPTFVDFSSADGSSHPDLRIDGYLGSTLVASRSFSSDPATDRLSVVADDAELAGDGVDETRVVFRAVDKYGAPRPYVGGQVQLAVTGPAVLVGDNPFDFAGTGAAGAVWLRTLPRSVGKVTVRAAHPTLGSGAVTIHILPPAPGVPPENYATSFAQVPPAPGWAVTAPPAANPSAGRGD
jgi:beta-galactosidase